jgi:hypothetical protein
VAVVETAAAVVTGTVPQRNLWHIDNIVKCVYELTNCGSYSYSYRDFYSNWHTEICKSTH